MQIATNLVDRAREIADEVFFPAAAGIDSCGALPRQLLDLLASEGFYGVTADPSDGGLDVAGLVGVGPMVEAFAGGCLSAAFVWLQHLGVVRGVSGADDPAVRRRWLAPLASGRCRSGIALAGLRPGPDQLRVHRTDSGWVLNGRAPWLTGWDLIDVVYVAAVDEHEVVHFLLMDAVSASTLVIYRPGLMAVQPSSTVEAAFREHPIPRDRLVTTRPLADWTAGNASGSALNGFLALGVASRCARLMQTDTFEADLARCRASLIAADPSRTPAARAEASLLAHRTAAALAVHSGSRVANAGSDGERLLREAGFLLVFASRPVIREALLGRLTVSNPAVSDGD